MLSCPRTILSSHNLSISRRCPLWFEQERTLSLGGRDHRERVLDSVDCDSVHCHSTRHAHLAILAQYVSTSSGAHNYDRSSPSDDASSITRRFSAVHVTASIHYPVVSKRR